MSQLGSAPSKKLFQRILCAVDFSETSDKAFDHAARLAHHLRAELVLLHAFDTPETLDRAGQTQPANHELRTKLESLKAPCEHVTVTRVLHAGDPGPVICWMAQNRSCDLIVMGTHGHTGLMHLLLGSVAEYVLSHARCPVLTIRNRPANEPLLSEPLVVPLPPPRLL